MKRPAFQFYPADWRKDSSLQSCSIGARGLWHELLCVMHESEPYGHLTLNGQPMPEDKVARLIGVEMREYRKLIVELEDAGVPSRTQSGILFSRRMVKDEATRNVRAIGGELGAEHGKKGAQHGGKGGRPSGEKLSTTGVINPPSNEQEDEQRGVSEPPLKPPPSSSSSSSSSNVVQNPDIDARSEPNNAFDKKKNGKTERWDASDQGIDAKGRELGVRPKPGESYFDFKARLWETINERSRTARHTQ